MQEQTAAIRQEQVIFPRLPLAVYRELAAHLQQVRGVRVQLLPPTGEPFDYQQSQVGGLLVAWPVGPARREEGQVAAILDYYGATYGPYQRQPYVEASQRIFSSPYTKDLS